MATKIVGGEFRGRKFRTPEGRTVRPTSSLLRKVIFDIVGTRIMRARILDVFAGVGTLGIEGLSRGAAHCTFVEKYRDIFCILKQNIRSLNLEDRSDIFCEDAVAWLERDQAKYDGILLDPPYHLSEQLEDIPIHRLLAEEGWLVFQHSSKKESRLKILYSRCRERRHGNTSVSFYELA